MIIKVNKKIYNLVKRIAYRHATNEQHCEDLTQIACMKIHGRECKSLSGFIAKTLWNIRMNELNTLNLSSMRYTDKIEHAPAIAEQENDYKFIEIKSRLRMYAKKNMPEIQGLMLMKLLEKDGQTMVELNELMKAKLETTKSNYRHMRICHGKMIRKIINE